MPKPSKNQSGIAKTLSKLLWKSSKVSRDERSTGGAEKARDGGQIFEKDGFGSKSLNSWLKEMQKNRMLRLFGIAETDDGDVFISQHALR